MYEEDHHLDMFLSDGLYLFRGARPSVDFPEPSRRLPVTPTSIDPIVATLYAARYRTEGPAIVMIARKAKFHGRIDGPSLGTYAGLELAVNLDMTPMEFEQEADKIITVEISLDILLSLGHDLPLRLPDYGALSNALYNSTRLVSEELKSYIDLAMGS